MFLKKKFIRNLAEVQKHAKNLCSSWKIPYGAFKFEKVFATANNQIAHSCNIVEIMQS